MARGKSINVYLIDGIASGKIKAQISNWNGIAYKIPRELLDECKDFEAFKQSGVYFLFGYKYVYVGQAEVRKNGKGIHQRILDHEFDKLKNSWDEVVIFSTKDNSLGRTDISYLEHRFFKKAQNAGRYNVLNASEPTKGTVTEEKESELEEFVDLAELILGALGYKVFEPIRQVVPVEEVTTEIPPLPDMSLDVGKFIYSAMRSLADSGFKFSDEQVTLLLDKQYCKKTFNINYPFLKKYDADEVNPHHIKGVGRFYSPYLRGRKKEINPDNIFTFGDYQFLVTKETYEKDHNKERFIEWYKLLKP